MRERGEAAKNHLFQLYTMRCVDCRQCKKRKKAIEPPTTHGEEMDKKMVGASQDTDTGLLPEEMERGKHPRETNNKPIQRENTHTTTTLSPDKRLGKDQ